jgi:hypothetical protein
MSSGRAPLSSLSEHRLHVPWATSHVPARSGRCPLVPFGMTGLGQADRRVWGPLRSFTTVRFWAA